MRKKMPSPNGSIIRVVLLHWGMGEGGGGVVTRHFFIFTRLWL